MRLIKKLLLWGSLLLLLVAGAGAYLASKPLDMPSLPLEFSVKQGESLKLTVRQLEAEGKLQDGWKLIWLARVMGKSTRIQAGNYELDSSPSPLELLEMLTSGRTSQRAVVLIDGWTFKQLRQALNENPDVAHDSLALSESEILQRIGASERRAEGLFFPDTYYIPKGVSDLTILKRAYDAMRQRLNENWQTRTSNLPLKSPYEALILASIVEKETGSAQDRAMIAAVFINRLRLGMLLQTDPTVIYGLGDRFDGNLRKRDLLTDTPYNTYTRAGLPPTPIAMPGLAALQATLNPAQSKALYFVARGDGSSEFSNTLEQHNRAVRRYQR
ncbi:MAG: endolytic transglycosylase MltG [Gallionellaceae bacterium]|jgi:UPF0755 protein|nr:endolytic transglycosylase MltG [Gallionellaceae bacterium]